MTYVANLARVPANGRLFTLGEFAIPGLDRRRRIDVHLPLGYEASPRDRYPVMYMWDGQNLFEPHRSYAGAWRVGASLDLLVTAGELPPMIVVGIDHGEGDRLSEQSPWSDERFDARGEGEAFMRFVTEVVKPEVDRALRTRPEARFTAVAGSSMGGLTSLYALHHAPHVFGRAAVFSPSLHFARGAVFDYIRGQQKPQGSRLYVDTGSREVGTGPRSRYIVDSSRRLDNLLRIKGWQPNQDYRWIVDPKGTHSESCWARRFPAAMRFLWGDLV